ncbi:MAG: response regulator transcription factor [Magnetospirillum sp.]|nr:response regulator transcription factor [Magnetospirillum sp.]
MKILLADDHALVRDGLVPFIERLQPGTTVVEASTFPDALELVRCGGVDLAVLDLYMPGMNGFGGLKEMKREYPDLPVVILSGSVRPENAVQAIENGASGYAPKTMRGETIVGVLRLVLSGERYIPPFLLEQRSGAMTAKAPPAATEEGSPLAGLTPRERDILDMIVDGAPNKVIARTLELQEVTVKAHLRNIFRKIKVSNRTEAARLAMVAGVTGRKTAQAAEVSGSPSIH